MEKMLDGGQKMSDWPEEARQYMQENPDECVLVGQSVHSQHRLLACRLFGKRLFIGYNKRLKCFTVWNVLPNIVNAQKCDDIHLRLSSKRQKQFASNPVFTAFYERVTGVGEKAVFQKICVFPEKDFMKFYSDYARYMKPSDNDLLYQTPVSDF